MTWNYRVVKTETFDGPTWGIYEVYYNDIGRPEARTANPITFTSDESAEDVVRALSLALETARTLGPLDDFEIGGLE